MSLPKGLTTPKPVMTTLLSIQLPDIKIKGQPGLTSAEAAPGKSARLLGADFVDVLDHIAHTLQLFCFLVGNFMAEFFFQRHDQFDCIQGIGAQVLDKFRVGSNLIGINAELLHYNLFYSLFRRFFCSHGLLRFCFCLSMPRFQQASSTEMAELTRFSHFRRFNERVVCIGCWSGCPV